MRTVRMPLVVASMAASLAVLSACMPTTGNNNYQGKVSSPGASAPLSTVSTPSVPAVPVTITGSGEQVETADLVATGYTVKYQASSWTLIVAPVQADGSDGSAVVLASGPDTSSGVTG